jgi:hypothetical protein
MWFLFELEQVQNHLVDVDPQFWYLVGYYFVYFQNKRAFYNWKQIGRPKDENSIEYIEMKKCKRQLRNQIRREEHYRYSQASRWSLSKCSSLDGIANDS